MMSRKKEKKKLMKSEENFSKIYFPIVVLMIITFGDFHLVVLRIKLDVNKVKERERDPRWNYERGFAYVSDKPTELIRQDAVGLECRVCGEQSLGSSYSKTELEVGVKASFLTVRQEHKNEQKVS